MFNIFNVIITLGAIQGFIVGLLLLIKEVKLKQAKFYLALVLLGFSAILTKITIIDIYENLKLPRLHLNFIFLIAPSLYLYINTLSIRINKTQSKKIIHFLPFIIINAGYLVFYILFNYASNYQDSLHNIIIIDEALSFIYFTIYLYASYKDVKRNTSLFSLAQNKWLKNILLNLLAFIVLWLVYIVAEWTYFHYNMKITTYYPMMIMLSIILYYNSFYVFNNKVLLFESNVFRKRKNIVIEENKSNEILKKLHHFMSHERPFLNGNISLNKLANSLGVNSKILSFVINEHHKKNFNDYINEWRIKEVKKRLKQKEYSHLKMLAIAYECGFNSKSTFNLAFKKATGLSPSSYKKEQ